MKSILNSAFLMCAFIGSAQISFNKTFHYSDNDYGRRVVECKEGGYAVVADVQDTTATYAEWFLLRTDEYGNELWHNSYPTGHFSPFVNGLIQTSDSGFVMTGTLDGIGSPDTLAVLKADKNGNELWRKTFPSTAVSEIGSYIIESSDGNLVISCFFYYSSSYSQIKLMKIDQSGNIIWSQLYMSTSSENPYCVREIQGVGYIIAAETIPGSVGSGDMCLIKTDLLGNIKWRKNYGTTGLREIAYSVDISSDGGFILGGEQSGNSNWDICYVRTDSAGNQQWLKSSGFPDQDRIFSVVASDDGGYVMAGEIAGGMSIDFYVVKYDSAGNYLWSFTDSTGLMSIARDIRVASDGGYVAAGVSIQWVTSSTANADIRLVKLLPSGFVSVPEYFADVVCRIYPIPAKTEINIASKYPVSQIVLFSTNGSIVKKVSADQNMNSIAVNDLENGMYIMRIETSAGINSKKIIIER